MKLRYREWDTILLPSVEKWNIMELNKNLGGKMNEAALIEMGEYLRNIKIPDVSDNTNFWLIRTMKGYFYDEFINQNYVALGWNFVTQNTSFDKMNIEILKDQIKERYEDKRPGVAINKCIRFIEEVKSGDYVLIPNSGSSEVTIGILV